MTSTESHPVVFHIFGSGAYLGDYILKFKSSLVCKTFVASF